MRWRGVITAGSAVSDWPVAVGTSTACPPRRTALSLDSTSLSMLHYPPRGSRGRTPPLQGKGGAGARAPCLTQDPEPTWSVHDEERRIMRKVEMAQRIAEEMDITKVQVE